MSEQTHKRKHSREDFYEQGADFMESASNYAANRPPLSDGLAGKVLTFNIDGKIRIRHTFDNSKPQLTWEFLEGELKGDNNTVPYESFEMSKGIFFISFLARADESVAAIIDFNKGVTTSYIGNLPKGSEEGHRVKTTVMSASIEELGGSAENLHKRSSLGGTRFTNIYNSNGGGIEYEHIYLTKVYKTWLGIRGPQAGQADTEEYHVYKIQDGIYFVSWTEKLLSTQMSFLFNFLDLRQVGQVFGLTGGKLVHQTIGAEMKIIHSALPELQGVNYAPPYSD